MPKKYPKGLIYCNIHKALVDIEDFCSKCEEICLDEEGKERLK